MENSTNTSDQMQTEEPDNIMVDSIFNSPSLLEELTLLVDRSFMKSTFDQWFILTIGSDPLLIEPDDADNQITTEIARVYSEISIICRIHDLIKSREMNKKTERNFTN